MLVRPWLLAIWILLTFGLSASAAGGFAAMSRVGWMLLAGWLGASLLVHVVDRAWIRTTHVAQRWGARLAHLGVAVAAGGLILSSAFTATSERRMAPGATVSFNGWTIQLHDVWPAAGAGWAGVAAELRASSGDGVILLQPQQRTYFDGSLLPGPATASSASGMLTAKVEARDDDNNWPILLRWTPLLILIPLGGMIAAIGGAVAMIGPPIARWRRLRRARLATAWWA